jgi:hypothetical protein
MTDNCSAGYACNAQFKKGVSMAGRIPSCFNDYLMDLAKLDQLRFFPGVLDGNSLVGALFIIFAQGGKSQLLALVRPNSSMRQGTSHRHSRPCPLSSLKNISPTLCS